MRVLKIALLAVAFLNVPVANAETLDSFLGDWELKWVDEVRDGEISGVVSIRIVTQRIRMHGNFDRLPVDGRPSFQFVGFDGKFLSGRLYYYGFYADRGGSAVNFKLEQTANNRIEGYSFWSDTIYGPIELTRVGSQATQAPDVTQVIGLTFVRRQGERFVAVAEGHAYLGETLRVRSVFAAPGVNCSEREVTLETKDQTIPLALLEEDPGGSPAGQTACLSPPIQLVGP